MKVLFYYLRVLVPAAPLAFVGSLAQAQNQGTVFQFSSANSSVWNLSGVMPLGYANGTGANVGMVFIDPDNTLGTGTEFSYSPNGPGSTVYGLSAIAQAVMDGSRRSGKL